MAKSALQRLLSEHRSWAKEVSTELETFHLGRLETQMENFYRERLDIGNSLDVLANIYGVRGLVEVADGQVAGWAKIAYSLDLSGWCFRIVLGARGADLTTYVSQMASLACCSSSWEVEITSGLKNLLTRRVPGDWDRRVFEPFALSVLENGRPIDCKGPYAKVEVAWDDPDLLAEALREVCTYHVENTSEKLSRFAEFRDPPFDLLPVEVMLVSRLKRAQGIELPPIHHELSELLRAPDDLPSVPMSPLLEWIELVVARS